MADDRLRGVLEALLVSFLWSSSYVLTKIGLRDTSPLLLVALRYLVASLVLVPVALARGAHRGLDRGTLAELALLGLAGYAVAQGLQCVGLYLLPAVTVTFILNFTPVIVLLINVAAFRRSPSPRQVLGSLVVLAGAYVFLGGDVWLGSPTGVLVTLASGAGWAVYLVAVGRLFARKPVEPLALSAFAMASGTVVIAGSAAALEGFAPITAQSAAIILWLGVVNTAAAFFLWNHALARVDAFEVSMIQNTMLIQIAVLSWLFLGETLTAAKAAGMALVLAGVLMVQTAPLRGGGRN